MFEEEEEYNLNLFEEEEEYTAYLRQLALQEQITLDILQLPRVPSEEIMSTPRISDVEEDPDVDPPTPRPRTRKAPTPPVYLTNRTITPYGLPLDLTDRTGLALYNKGAAELDIQFDGKTATLTPFLADLQVRGNKCAWRILNVLVSGSPINILQSHGRISQDHIDRDHATYLNQVQLPKVHIANDLQQKDVIDRKMLYDCVEVSLTEKYKKTIATRLPGF